MAHAIGVRATSFVASAAVLGLLTLGALTMTFVHQQIIETTTGTIVDVVREPPPPEPPPVQEQRPIQNVAPIAGDGFPVEELPPLTPATFPADPGPVVVSYPPPTISDPTWVRRPRDLGRYYPARARERGIEGSATLNCAVDTGGALHCTVVSETPTGWGFGEAAVRMAGDHRMVPASRDGQAIEARHRMVIPFRLQ